MSAGGTRLIVRRVLKWKVPIGGDLAQVGGGPVLFVQMQHSELCVWTDERYITDADGVEPDVPTPRTVCVVGTGQLAPHYGEHIGSVIDGSFVWHVFEGAR